MSLEAEREEIRKLSAFGMIARLQDLANKAALGDAKAMQLLTGMLKDCSDPAIWHKDSRYASAVIHAMGRVRSMKAMQQLVGLARGLPEGTPAGAIELIASILPEFRRFAMGPLRELMERKDGSPAYLVGVQALCNLYIEGHLEGSDVEHLADALEGVETGDYLTQHIVDLVRTDIRQHRAEEHEALSAALGELVG